MPLWLKKLNVFLIEKHSIFQNNKVENFRNLENLQSRRDFFKCLQAITLDTFTLANSNFLCNSEVLPQYLQKNETSLILECFLLVSSCHNF